MNNTMLNTQYLLNQYENRILNEQEGIKRFCSTSEKFAILWKKDMYKKQLLKLANLFLRETKNKFFKILNDENDYRYLFYSTDNLIEFCNLDTTKIETYHNQIRKEFLKYLINKQINIFNL